MNPRLERWTIYNGSLVGDIYDDTRFPIGERIVTAEIKDIDFDKKVARTKNTTYRLGEPLGGTIQASKEEGDYHGAD